jgi:putative ABC transport system permease protein
MGKTTMGRFTDLRRALRVPGPPAEMAEREVDDEVRFHLEERARELEASGLSAAAARSRALREFGDLETARRLMVPGLEGVLRRDRRRAFRDELRQDVRYGLRKLRSSPGFTVVALLTLALGMGATAAIFSVVNGVLLRPLAFASPEQLVIVWENDRVTGTVREPASVPDFYDFRERNRVFSGAGLFRVMDGNLTRTGAEPQRVSMAALSSDVFPLLGVAPLLGRGFTEAEDEPGGARVVVLSESFWRSEYGANRSAVGAEVTLDDSVYVVVGVMPAAFEFPDAGVRLWVPAKLGPTSLPRYTHPVTVVARLRPGVTVGSAQADLTRIAADLEAEYPQSNTARGVFVEPVLDVMFSRTRPALMVLLAGVCLLLVISCVNVASLLLARGLSRSREVAVRATLGAGRGRIARQFVVESLMLSLLAAVIGILFARLSLRGLIAVLPADLPRADLVTVDWLVLSLAVALASVVGVVFGVAPAMQARRLNVQGVLKAEADRTASASRSRQLTRSSLVVAEVAISFVLVIGAALLVRTVLALRAVDPGFDSRNVLRMEFQLPASRYPADYSVYPRWPRHQRLYTELQADLERIPGVVSSALAAAHPLAEGFTNSFVIVGREAESATQPEIHVRAVTSGYVRTLGVRLLDGRDLEPSDGADQPAVALINEAAARRFFPAGDAIGRQLSFWGVTREIVGIIGNERFQGLTAESPPAVYLSLVQAPMATGSVLVRTAGDPMGVATAVRSAVRAVDPELAVFDVATLDQTVLRSISRERSTMLLLATFAAVALLLALVGVHGVLAYTVSQRTRELGVRVALGASRWNVLGLVLRQGIVLSLAGILIGLLAALAGTRLLGGILWGVKATDPLTWAAVTALMLVVAALACWFPARRAVRIDPVQALRAE